MLSHIIIEYLMAHSKWYFYKGANSKARERGNAMMNYLTV